MKKRTLAIILMVTVLASMMLTGCGDSEPSNDKEIVENTNKEEKEDDNKDSGKVMIEEAVLLDEKGIKITATGLEDGMFGTDLKLLIENNGETNVTIQANYASVNGYMADTMMSEDVAAGKKANTELTFSIPEDANIKTIATMEFKFHIFETESWDEYLDSDTVVVETSAVGSYEQAYDDSGNVLYEGKGIKIVGKGLSADDSIFGPGLLLYIENNSDKDITVQARDTSVNGFMVDPSMSQDIVSGKKALTAVTFFESDLEDNGIEEIEVIETSFHVFEMEDWDDIVDTDVIEIMFE